MKPGPPPKPVERQRAVGNPGHKKLATQVVALPSLKIETPAPEHLGNKGAALWLDVTDFARAWLGYSDLAILTALCEAIDRRDILMQTLTQDGYFLQTDKGYRYAHPALGALSTLEQQITKWFAMLGLTPTDRARLGVAEVQVKSKLEELRSRARL
jgi:P27 family predicted phage terminase small subunit